MIPSGRLDPQPSGTKRIRIVLVDELTLFRAGIRALLQQLQQCEVIAEASNGHAALTVIRQHKPDIVLMEISMPDMNGLEALRHVATTFPQVRVVILSHHCAAPYVAQALRAGARGYLLKDAIPRELEIAIVSAMKGDLYLSPRISSLLVERNDNWQTRFETLTPCQRRVLELVAEGCSSREIARHLDRSIKSVEYSRKEIKQRLGICDIAGLVRCAVRNGLIDP